ncbi:hypothetical protein, partial [Paenirhodobacter populi]
ALLCGSLQAHLGTQMPSEGGHIIKASPLCFRCLSEVDHGMLIVESEPVRRHWFEPNGERKNQATAFYRGQGDQDDLP